MMVLLTGGAGYIGAHTCVALIESGHDIVVADNYVNSQPEAMRRVMRMTGRTFPVYDIDVCDGEAMERLFSEQPIDAVIHFAGLKAVAESVAEPLKYYRTNLDATLTLCETMQRHDVKKLVFSSSATVYGKVDVSPIPEQAELGCSNPYGWTKFMIEQILRDLAVARPDWAISLLRYFNPVGAHPSGQIGENPNGRPNNLMPNVLNAAWDKQVFSVFGDDYPTADGTCVRDYIHVMDLARGHVKALQYVLGHAGAQAFNLGTGVGYSVLDIINAFTQSTGVSVEYEFGPRRPGDVPSYYADPAKAEELLDWRAEKTLQDMCRDSWAFKINNPRGYEA